MKKCSHPWINDRCHKLVRDKVGAEGTIHYRDKQRLCIEGLQQEFEKCVNRIWEKVSSLKPSSKRWWKLCDAMMLKSAQTSCIPPLYHTDGSWKLDAVSKSECFAQMFANKYSLAEIQVNEFSSIPTNYDCFMSGFLPVRARYVHRILKQLDEGNGTGPDLLPAKILKYCAQVLSVPTAILCRLILASGIWPTVWKLHWLFPLHKKKSKTNPVNYRGIHLTSQLSKVVKRLFAMLFAMTCIRSLLHPVLLVATSLHTLQRVATGMPLLCVRFLVCGPWAFENALDFTVQM